MRGMILLLGLLIAYHAAYGFELRTFRIPTHTVHALRVQGSFDLNGDHWVDDGGRSNNSYHSGRVDGIGYWLFDSENFGLEAIGSTRVSNWGYGDEGRSRTDSNHSNYDRNYNSFAENYDARARGVYFPMQLPLSILFGGAGEADVSQANRKSQWNQVEDTLRSHSNSKERSSTFQYRVRGEVGFGWGRIRDASAVYQAYVIEQRLKEMGRIRGELSDATRQELASLLYQRDDYDKRNERSERFFWRDAEAILVKDPAVTGKLDAFALYRINEMIAPGNVSRWSGWRLSLNWAALHSNYIYREHVEFARHEETDSTIVDTTGTRSYSRLSHYENMLFGPRLEVNYPLSWNVQLSGDSRFEHRVHPADDGFFWTTLLRGQYAVHDRWLLSYTFLHERYVNDPKDRNRHNGQMWSLEHAAGASYYVEDNVELGLFLYHSQNRAWDFVPNSGAPQYERHVSNYSLSVNVAYLFAGNAPMYAGHRFFPRSGINVFGSTHPRSYSPYYYY